MIFTKDNICIHADNVESILLRLPNWLGDSVMVSPTFEWLKKVFDKAYFSIVGTKASCGIYQRDKRIKHIFIDDSKDARCRLTATKKLANIIGRHDIAISFSNTFFSALLLYWTKSKIRIGYAKNARSFLLSHALTLHKYDKQGNINHQVVLYLMLIANLLEVKKYLLVETMRDSQDSNNIVSILAKQSLSIVSSPIRLDAHKYSIGINPGAAFGSAKCWEKTYFIEVVEYFLSQSYDVYLFGSSEHNSINKEIADSVSTHTNISLFHNLTDKTNLTQLVDYIGAMDIFITNDSGPMHIAAALKVPTVVIFGSTNMKETSPYSPNYLHNNTESSTESDFAPYFMLKNPPCILISKNLPCSPCKKRECPLRHHQCMTLITPQEVITNTLRLLKYQQKG